MQSKNKPRPTRAQSDHIVQVKALPCSVCDAPGPSECHEIKQGQWFSSMALCTACHRGPMLGLHGGKGMWRIKKMDEIDGLAKTIERLMT